MKKKHVSFGMDVPGGRSGSGRTLDHVSTRAKTPTSTAPNAPGSHASGKPQRYEGGGAGKQVPKPSPRSYAKEPKHLKQ